MADRSSPPVPVAAGKALTLIRRGERMDNSTKTQWWQELPEGETAEGLRSVGYEVVRFVREAELVSARELLAEAREALREIEQIEPKGDRLQNPSAHAMRDYAREALAVPDRSTKDDDDG